MTASPHRVFIAHALALLLVLCSAFDVSAFEPAAFTPNVVDETGTLTPTQLETLNAHIQTLRERADLQAGIYLVRTTGDAEVEEAARVTFERWALGERGRDNGVLLLFALDDRRARIETGYGVEADVTDLHARRILDEVILPRFKEEAFAEGLTAGLFALGYVKTKDAFFLSPPGGVALNADALTAEPSPPFDAARGFRYWAVWAALLWLAPIPFRLRAQRRKGRGRLRLKALLGFEGAWFVRVFLTVNPGIFIFLSPLFLDPVLSATSAWLTTTDGRGVLLRWPPWWLALLLAPVALRVVGYGIGRARARARPNSNPVFALSRAETVRFLLGVERGSSAMARLVVAGVGGLLLAAAPLLPPSQEVTWLLGGMAGVVLLGLLAVEVGMVIRPLVSARAWRRGQARERLARIQNRVKRSRPIFGKTWTYHPPSSSSSSSSGSSGSRSSGSSFSSSSGGGRSGGGGASSGW